LAPDLGSQVRGQFTDEIKLVVLSLFLGGVEDLPVTMVRPAPVRLAATAKFRIERISV
jgi:hypothetical protein